MLAKVETVFGQDANPSPTTDALLVENPDVTADLSLVERSNVKFDLSPDPPRVGRKTMGVTFLHEVRNNENLDGTVAPLVGRLLQGCGMAETQFTGVGTNIPFVAAAANTGASVTWAALGTNPLIKKSKSRITIVLAGASATAVGRVTGGNTIDDTEHATNNGVVSSETFLGKTHRILDDTPPVMTVTPDTTDPLSVDYVIAGAFTVDDIVEAIVLGIPFRHTVVSGDTDADGVATALAAVINAHGLMAASATTDTITVTFTGVFAGEVLTTAATPVTIGSTTCTQDPTWTGDLDLGDTYSGDVHSEGYEYDPVSDLFDSLTLYIYLDGLLHKLTGCRGTFTVEGAAGEVAKYTFTFTGNYVAPLDAAIPVTPNLDTTLPPAVEQADLQVDGGITPLCAAAFGLDMANNVVIRDCVNKVDAFDGVVITGRAPSATMDPESVLESDHPFWANLAAGTPLLFQVRVGTVKGNLVHFESDNASYSELGYGNRNDIRIYNVTLRFSRTAGNDEINIAYN